MDREMWKTLYMKEGTNINDMWLKMKDTMQEEMAAQQRYMRSFYVGATPDGEMRTLTSLYKTGYIKRDLGIAVEFTDQEIGEVIRQAATLLETYGWIQNAKGDVIHGFCTIGAIDYAAHSQQFVNIGNHLYSAASKKFFDWLVEAGITEHSIATWNDQPERSRDEIVLYMNKFAEEMAPAPTPVPPRPLPRLVL